MDGDDDIAANCLKTLFDATKWYNVAIRMFSHKTVLETWDAHIRKNGLKFT